MSDIKLDLKGFKHVKSDKNSTTLRHDKGHEITLAHNVLSPKNREALQSMAGQDAEKADYGKVIRKAKGGHIEHPSMTEIEGGGATAYDAGLPCLNPNCKSHGKPHPNCRCYSGGEMMAEGGQISKLRYCAHGKSHMAGCEYGVSEQGKDVRHGNKSGAEQAEMAKHHAKEEAKGRAEMERTIKPKLQGLKDGGNVKFMGTEVLGTGKADTPAQGGGRSPDQDAPWPSPSTTSVGQANAKPASSESIYEPASPPESDAKGGRVGRRMYAEGSGPIPGQEEGIQDDKPSLGQVIGEAWRHATTYKGDSRPHGQSIGELGKPQMPPKPVEQNPANPNFNSVSGQMQDPQSRVQTEPEAQDQSQPDAGTQNSADMEAPQQGQPQPQASDNTTIPQSQMEPTDITHDLAQTHTAENKAWTQDLNNGHITPKTYNDLMYHNKDGSEKSTLGKIGSIFGLMLSGAGSGLAHQPNQALAMMDNVIKNDLEAQKTSKADAQNFLRLNQQRLLNNAHIKQALADTSRSNAEKQAIIQGINMKSYTQAYMDMSSSALHKQIEDLKNMPEGPDKQKATQVAMMMANAVNENNAKTAVLGAAGVNALGMYGGGNQQDPESQFDQSVRSLEMSGNPIEQQQAARMRARHIPGVPGNATRDIPENIRNTVQAMNVLDDKGKDVLNYVNQHRGTWNPQKRAVAAQKIEEMKNFYNDSIKGGALTQGRLGWYDEQFAKNPTDILAQLMGSSAKLGEMVKSNAHRRDMILSGPGGLGFQVPQAQNQPKPGPGGKMYIQQGKYMVPVK